MRNVVLFLGVLAALAATVLLIVALWHDALQSLYVPILFFAMIAATCASYLRNARRPKQ